MKRSTSSVIGSLVAILIIIGACGKMKAQDSPAVFTVPFAFSADGHDLPAGTYKVRLVSGHPWMSIRNLNTGKKQVFSVHPGEAQTSASHASLVFRRCGDRNDLAEFHIPGTNLYSETITPKSVRNMEARSCGMGNDLTVASR